jgi:Arc/MetJ-type ribon-helix-helix transcriptional regulator
MGTISVPLNKEHEGTLDSLVKSGIGSSRADVMRKALKRLSEEEAILAVLRASREPSLSGDLRSLAKKLK